MIDWPFSMQSNTSLEFAYVPCQVKIPALHSNHIEPWIWVESFVFTWKLFDVLCHGYDCYRVLVLLVFVII